MYSGGETYFPALLQGLEWERKISFILDKCVNSFIGNFCTCYEDFGNIIMPDASFSPDDCREMFNALQSSNDEGQSIDCRSVIIALVNFVPDFSLEEKCRLAFKMYDIDFSGYATIDIIESVLMSTNLVSTRDLVKKRAGTFMACADKDGTSQFDISQICKE
jgi:Ca2+-binding EF-hand superfamily protein